MLKLHIFTALGAEKFIDQWLNGAHKSLMWPENRKALEEVEASYSIGAAPDLVQRVNNICSEFPFPAHVFKSSEGRAIAENALIEGLQRAAQEEALFLFLPSDFIYGDGSIRTLIKMASMVPGRCIAAPHVRVDEGRFMKAFTGEPMTNAQLVKKSFEMLHGTFTNSEIPSQTNNCYTGGVAWTRIKENLFAGTFYLPSIHCLQPRGEDVRYFKNARGAGHWDHQWPSTLLESDRYRLIGSSDGAFAAELTREGTAISESKNVTPSKMDEYQKSMPHHVANKRLVCIFRGE